MPHVWSLDFVIRDGSLKKLGPVIILGISIDIKRPYYNREVK